MMTIKQIQKSDDRLEKGNVVKETSHQKRLVIGQLIQIDKGSDKSRLVVEGWVS